MEKETMSRLVGLAKRGDAEAFASLYKQYYKQLYKAAYYILGNAAEAEDTVMDAVCDAYAGIGGLRAAEAFEGWLFKILYNKAKRRRGAIYCNATDELSENAAERDRADEIGENADLINALGELSGEERSIVTLSVCLGYTSGEVAKIMSLNANTVRSKQMRALAKLKAKLTKGEGGKTE